MRQASIFDGAVPSTPPPPPPRALHAAWSMRMCVHVCLHGQLVCVFFVPHGLALTSRQNHSPAFDLWVLGHKFAPYRIFCAPFFSGSAFNADPNKGLHRKCGLWASLPPTPPAWAGPSQKKHKHRLKAGAPAISPAMPH